MGQEQESSSASVELELRLEVGLGLRTRDGGVEARADCFPDRRSARQLVAPPVSGLKFGGGWDGRRAAGEDRSVASRGAMEVR